MDVPIHEDGAADDEVIIFTEVNYYFSIVYEITYSMLFHDSLFLFLHPTLALRSPSKSNMCVMECHQLSSAASSRNHPCPLHLHFQWGRRPR